MQNEGGQKMDLYIPRKCSATNRLITSKDHASVQLNVGHLGPDGVYTNQFSPHLLFVASSALRVMLTALLIGSGKRRDPRFASKWV